MGRIVGSFSRAIVKSLGEPAKGETEDVLEAVTDTGEESVVTEGITNPPTPRNITVTAGGKAEDIKAIKVTVEGTDEAGNEISEEIGPFTVNTAGTKTGAKAFATVTKVKIPAHDGEEATTAVGLGQALGLGEKLSLDTVQDTYLGGTRESTRSTVVVSNSAISSNTVTLNSELAEEEVKVIYFHTA